VTYTNDYKEQHIDLLYDWVMDKKYDDAVEWCNGSGYHADDDFEQIIECYIEDNEEDLWKEYFQIFGQ